MARNDGSFYVGFEVVIEYQGIRSMIEDVCANTDMMATETGDGIWLFQSSSGRNKRIRDNREIMDIIRDYVRGRWDFPWRVTGADCLEYVDKYTSRFSWYKAESPWRDKVMADVLLYGEADKALYQEPYGYTG